MPSTIIPRHHKVLAVAALPAYDDMDVGIIGVPVLDPENLYKFVSSNLVAKCPQYLWMDLPTAATGQGEIFQSLDEMGPDEQLVDLGLEHEAATRTILELTPAQPDAILYDQLWPQVLARNIARKVDLKKIAAKLRTEGRLLIPDWEKGKHVPQGRYRLQRPKN